MKKKQTELRSKIQLARLDMKEIYLSDKIDRSALEKLMKQVSDLQYQQKLNFVDFWFSVNSMLTPEQQKVWKEHVGQMAGQMQRMRGAMRGRMMNRGPMQRGMMMPHPQEENDN
jgi:Spy/CpxP family protein refolding chaperone